MEDDPRDYYRSRELAERAAARSATCPQARRAHEELANAYALRANSQDEPKSNPV